MQSAGEWVGLIIGLVALAELCRRLLRLGRRLLRTLRELAEGIRAAGRSSIDLAVLAGSTTLVVVRLYERLDAQERATAWHEERLDDIAELLTDALADLSRMKKAS